MTSQFENRISAFGLCMTDSFDIRNSAFDVCPIQRLYSMLRSLFFLDRNTDAARPDQHEETGNLFFLYSSQI
jgi:hypothetical protein